MKCIIVDDEPLAREGIELNIQQIPFLELLNQFGNAMTANDFLAKEAVDLMFLDIEMPGISGLEFIRSLKKAPISYSDYGLSAIRVGRV